MPSIHSSFLARLASFVDGAVEPIDDLSGFWNRTRPAGAGNATIDSYFNHTYPVIISARQRELVRDPFFAAYAATHGGRRPAVDPVPIARWKHTENMTADDIHVENQRRQMYERWFGSNVISKNYKTCSNALLLYPGSSTPKPRNRYLSDPSIPFGLDHSKASTFSGVPDFVVPLGVSSYNSTITGKTEYLPVSVDIMAAKGCDGMLFALILDLVEAGILSTSMTGYSPVGEGESLLLQADQRAPVQSS